MKKQSSCGCHVQPVRETQESPRTTKQSITFAELAEEEAKEQASLVENTPVSDEVNIYEKMLDKNVSKGILLNQREMPAVKNIIKGMSNISSVSDRMTNFKATSSFSNDVIYNQINRDRGYGPGFKSYNKCLDNVSEQIEGSSKYETGKLKEEMVSLENNKANNAVCLNCLHNNCKAYRGSCVQDPDSDNEAGAIKSKLAELELENEYYISKLFDVQNHLQNLEKSVTIQNKKNAMKIDKLKALLKEHKIVHAQELGELSVAKNKQIHALEKENENLKERLRKLSAQVKKLNKGDSKILTVNLKRRNSWGNDYWANKNLYEENQKLKSNLQQLEAEVQELYSNGNFYNTLVNEIENQVENQNKLIEQNKELQVYIKNLEARTRDVDLAPGSKNGKNKHDSALYNHGLKNEKSNRSLRLFTNDNLNVDNETPNSSLELQNPVNKRRMAVNKQESANNKKCKGLRKLFGNQKDSKLDKNVAKGSNKILMNMLKENTLKSTNFTMEDERYDPKRFLKGSRKINNVSDAGKYNKRGTCSKYSKMMLYSNASSLYHDKFADI